MPFTGLSERHYCHAAFYLFYLLLKKELPAHTPPVFAAQKA